MRALSLARQLLLLQLGIVLVAVAVTAAFAVGGARARAVEQQRARVVATATTLAESAEVKTELVADRPADRLAPLAERTRAANGFAFVVFMSPQGIRFSHPTPSEIGRPYVGAFRPALEGGIFTETRTGTLGRSVRAVAPVRSDRSGRIVGLVAVGVLQTTVAAQARAQLPTLGAAVLVALLVGAVGSLLLSRRVKRQTRDMDPAQLATLYDHHEAVLQAIREGVVVVDPGGVVRLLNDEARRLLGVPGEAVGKSVDEVIADPSLRRVLRGEREDTDGLHVVGGRVLVSGRRSSVGANPIAPVGGTEPAGGSPVPADDHDDVDSGNPAIGTVTTLRDRTELEGLVRELATVRSLADALRAQAHEAANELHTVVGLVELGRYEDAVAFATRRISVSQDEVDVVQHHVADPALAALLLAKAATCRERGVHLELDPASDLRDGAVSSEDLVTIVGNLIDNALDALERVGSGEIEVLLHAGDHEATIRVADDGPGFAPEALEAVFEPGWSTKPGTGAGQRGLGLALVEATVRRLGGTATAQNDDGAVILVVVPATDRSEVPA